MCLVSTVPRLHQHHKDTAHTHTIVHAHTHMPTVHVHTTPAPAASYLATFLAFSLGSCCPMSPRGCTFPCETAGHLGENLAKTGDAKQPRLRNLPRDRAARVLGGALGWPCGLEWSTEDSLLSVTEGPQLAPDQLVSPLGSRPEELSKATRMGEGQMAMLGRRMKRLGEGKGFLGERQAGEKGPEGEGGTQVPVYTAR